MSKHKKTSVRGDSGADISEQGDIIQPVATPEVIEQRARELALISGRDQNHITESDRILARRELAGDEAANQPADEAGIVAGGMGVPPVSEGHQTPKYLPTDDEDEANSARHGVDQAEHEQMVAATKIRTRHTG